MRGYEGKRTSEGVEVNVRGGESAPWRPLCARLDLAVGETNGLAWGGLSRESEQLAVAILADHFAENPMSSIAATYHAIDAGLLDADAQPTFDELSVLIAPAFLLEVVSRFARTGWFLYDWQVARFVEQLRPESMKRDTWPACEPMEERCPASR